MRRLLARAPILALLALVLTLLVMRSSLASLLPFDVARFPAPLYVFAALALALVPAWLARETPLSATAAVVVPVLVVSSYGASRLDWLRLLKDFGVAETAVIDPLRLALAALALVLLWTLHAVDLAQRLRRRAIERGIEPAQASLGARRTLRRNAEAGAIAVAGAGGLLAVGIIGLQLARALPTQRAALVAPLVAAALLVAAAVWLARGRAETE